MTTPLVGRQRTIVGRRRVLMRWYRTHGRHHLPWRHTRDPYAILVSEVMLQQTQVDRVIPYWTTWMQRWPTCAALARAKRASVIRAWAGLGYNRRAVNLHQLAMEVERDVFLQELFHRSPHPPHAPPPKGKGETKKIFSPSIPEGEREGVEIARLATILEQLPGVGPYTANALLAFVWNLPAPCVDTNVRRVLAHAIYQRPAIMRMPLRRVMQLAERVIPREKSREWNYALMDYGALVLRARDIPNRPKRKTEPFHNSDRFWRGRIVAVFRASHRAMPAAVLRNMLVQYGDIPSALDALLVALARDGVIRRTTAGYRLA
ncbi:MAG: hypothetical protein Q7S02_05495 [bacterium]|nr:hypothetical protein [bacterium]